MYTTTPLQPRYRADGKDNEMHEKQLVEGVLPCSALFAGQGMNSTLVAFSILEYATRTEVVLHIEDYQVPFFTSVKEVEREGNRVTFLVIEPGRDPVQVTWDFIPR
jgi:hypothetical protein